MTVCATAVATRLRESAFWCEYLSFFKEFTSD